MIAPDSTVRPHLPRWLGCRITVVPQSLCIFPISGTSTADASALDNAYGGDALDQRATSAQTAQARPGWFTDTELLDAHGRVHLACAPLGAADCLQLLEHAASSCDLIDAAEGLDTDVAEDDGLRLFTFADVAEAQRRAVLLMLLTYDPMLGASPPAVVTMSSSGVSSFSYPVRSEAGSEVLTTGSIWWAPASCIALGRKVNMYCHSVCRASSGARAIFRHQWPQGGDAAAARGDADDWCAAAAVRRRFPRCASRPVLWRQALRVNAGRR